MIAADEEARLASAIREAEALTAGEIVVVVAARADSYRVFPLLWGLLAALLVPWPLLAFTALAPKLVFLIQLAGALVLSLGLSWPRIRFALVPGAIKRAQAHEAAAHEFVDHGLTRTRDRSGVLIYVAAAERYAEVLADTGIAGRVDQDVWCAIVADLVDAIRDGRMAEGLITAVRRIGAILAEHAPARSDDSDELPNKVILL